MSNSERDKDGNIEHFSMKQWIERVDKKLDNHLHEFTENLVKIETSMASMSKDIEWISKFFWLIAGVTITAIIGSVMALILK